MGYPLWDPKVPGNFVQRGVISKEGRCVAREDVSPEHPGDISFKLEIGNPAVVEMTPAQKRTALAVLDQVIPQVRAFLGDDQMDGDSFPLGMIVRTKHFTGVVREVREHGLVLRTFTDSGRPYNVFVPFISSTITEVPSFYGMQGLLKLFALEGKGWAIARLSPEEAEELLVGLFSRYPEPGPEGVGLLALVGKIKDPVRIAHLFAHKEWNGIPLFQCFVYSFFRKECVLPSQASDTVPQATMNEIAAVLRENSEWLLASGCGYGILPTILCNGGQRTFLEELVKRWEKEASYGSHRYHVLSELTRTLDLHRRSTH